MGPVVNVNDKESGTIFTSHESLLNAPKTEILHYQNMEAAFVNEKGNQVKCQCIVFCQVASKK